MAIEVDKNARRPGVAAILAELRREVRRQGIGAVELARRAGVAEPTMRRWLNGRGLSLDALDMVCGLLGIDVRDLVARGDAGGADRFTLAQERVLAADRGLALLFFAILNGATRADIAGEFGLPPDRIAHLLDRLERLGLIDLAPGDRLRALTSRAVRWRRGGPLAAAFERTVKAFFLSMDFGAADALYVSDMVRLSAAGRARLLASFEALREDIHVIAGQDRAARLDRYDWSAVLMLTRPLDIVEVTRELR